MSRKNFTNKSKKRNIRRKQRVGLVITFYVLAMFLAYFSTYTGESVESVADTVYIDSRTVRYGDTLWSIAQSYNSTYYNSTKEYVQAIKECNNLYSDEIYAGTKLIIPYTK